MGDWSVRKLSGCRFRFFCLFSMYEEGGDVVIKDDMAIPPTPPLAGPPFLFDIFWVRRPVLVVRYFACDRVDPSLHCWCVGPCGARRLCLRFGLFRGVALACCAAVQWVLGNSELDRCLISFLCFILLCPVTLTAKTHRSRLPQNPIY